MHQLSCTTLHYTALHCVKEEIAISEVCHLSSEGLLPEVNQELATLLAKSTLTMERLKSFFLSKISLRWQTNVLQSAKRHREWSISMMSILHILHNYLAGLAFLHLHCNTLLLQNTFLA